MQSPNQLETINLPPLIVLIGPTAVGKTETAIRLAERLDGEIISADSRLFYRGMNIGTAKPTPAEQARVPHHLIDIAAPDQVISLANFQAEVRQLVDEIVGRGRLPFLVGGTGQYVKAIVENWLVPEAAPDERLRLALEAWAAQIGAQALHDRLAVLDPQAAAQIQAQNLRRTIRALEVIFNTGQRFSEQRRRGPQQYRSLILGLNRPRPELYARIDARIQAMLDQGLLDEVRQLLSAGYDPELPALSAIGYRQMIDHLRGELTLDEAITQMKRITRQFVRRQANWFKPDDPDILWFDATADPLSAMETAIRQFIQAAE